MDFLGESYEPGDDDIVCTFRVAPGEGLSVEAAADGESLKSRPADVPELATALEKVGDRDAAVTAARDRSLRPLAHIVSHGPLRWRFTARPGQATRNSPLRPSIHACMTDSISKSRGRPRVPR